MVSYIDNTIQLFKKDESLLEKCLIGIGLMMLSFLVIPMFLYQGYQMRILEETENGFPNQLPEWGDYTELLKYGLISFGISLVALIPGYALMFIPSLSGIESTAIIVASGFFGFTYTLTVGYIFVALLAITFRESFDSINVSRLKTIALSKDYFIGWLVVTLIGIVLSIVYFVITLLTLGFGSIFVIPFFIPISYATMAIMGVAVTEAEREE